MRRMAWSWVVGAVAALLLGIETAVRLSGVIDFPLYVANSEIGYIPAPSQKGAFLGRNEWIFNEFSMGAGAFAPSAKAVDTLLIGDSIVLGGNPYRQQDKLGPVLSELSGVSVWPISAGSWALRNELKYLKLNQRVTRNIDRFVFVLNAEDFAGASSWACERTHPRQRPWSAALYLFRKQVWDWDDCKTVDADLTVAAGDWKADLREFLTSPEAKNKPVSFYLYPKRKRSRPQTSPRLSSTRMKSCCRQKPWASRWPSIAWAGMSGGCMACMRIPFTHLLRASRCWRASSRVRQGAQC